MPQILKRYIIAAILAVSTLFLVQGAVIAGEGPFQSSFLGAAADGYDVVAYHTEGKAIEGNSDISHKWKNVTWRFSSAANRDMFVANPAKYAPEYGGYCAYAVAQGSTASIDPEAWTIVGGKLYLNYSKSVQQRWEKDIPGYISSADQKWPDVKKSL